MICNREISMLIKNTTIYVLVECLFFILIVLSGWIIYEPNRFVASYMVDPNKNVTNLSGVTIYNNYGIMYLKLKMLLGS